MVSTLPSYGVHLTQLWCPFYPALILGMSRWLCRVIADMAVFALGWAAQLVMVWAALSIMEGPVRCQDHIAGPPALPHSCLTPAPPPPGRWLALQCTCVGLPGQCHRQSDRGRLINFAPSTPLKEVVWELEIEHIKEALGLGIGLGLGEQFSAEVMDTALALHNAVMTSQAAVWKGYESAYEGDSYTIAFHTAQSAVQFALAVQKALLTVDWPLQLLDQAELCRPFIVLPAAASSQLPAFHPAALAAGSSTFASVPLAVRLSLASRPEQPTVASYLRRLRPSQDMYFKRSTQSLELGPRTEPQQPSSATALPNQAAQHTLYASPTALVSPATLKPAMVSAPSTGCMLSGPFTLPSGQAGQAGDASTSNYLSASTNTTLDEADLFSAAEAFLTSNSRGQYDGTSPAAWSMQPSALLKGWPGSNGVSESDHGAFCDAAPLTLHQHLLRSTAVVPSGTAGSLLLFRGLRVRMGMHTGVHDPSDVARDAGTGRQRYSGAILAAAKAVQDCAQGGQVLISEATFAEASAAWLFHTHGRVPEAHAPPGWKHITVCAHAAAGVAGPARGPGGDAWRAARFEGGQGA
ncbi:uncharacterized protein HaLaN_22596 [Haematococcus lacustris]|uniref:Guanylate cyclase domain-containing protein n=1 Tax=Haematococcus lacustris TaxID=44745 RepID=A0A699ZPY8_HAELA|nr:uncharacterized protein HaLaN_22596 [Haematococcus lacustris]